MLGHRVQTEGQCYDNQSVHHVACFEWTTKHGEATETGKRFNSMTSCA